jgi:glycosyltransferase involved in cell wall biosynthesis
VDVTSRYGARRVVEPIPGLARARNRGARCCNTDLVAYLDDDCLPAPDWLERILAEFQDDHVIAVSGRVEGIVPEQGVEPWHWAAARDSRRPQRRRVDGRTAGWFEFANFGALGDGGNMAFRRAAFQVWPGFDERLGRGAALDCGEEHYAFFNLVERGYRLVYTPAAVVLHPAPQQPDEIRRRMLRDRAATVAYMTLLLAERPRYALRLLKFIIEAMLGRRRAWRLPAAGSVRVSRWRLLAAASSGLLLYLRLRVVPSRRISQVPASSSVPD